MIFKKRENKEQEILQAISDAFLNSALDLDRFLKDTVKIIAEKFPVECAEIRLIDSRNPDLLVGESVYVVGREERETKEKIGKINCRIDNTLLGDVYKTGETYVFDEQLLGPIENHEKVNQDILRKYCEILPSKIVRNFIATPLSFQISSPGRKKLGCLRITNKMNERGRLTSKGFTEEEKHALERIASRVPIALKGGLLFKEAQEQLKVKKTLEEIPTSPKLDEVMEKIQNSLCEFFDSKVSTVWTYDKQNRKLVLRYSKGLTLEEVPKQILDEDNSVIGRTLREKGPVPILDLTKETVYAWREIIDKLGSKQLLAVPFVNPEGDIIGVIALHPADDFGITLKDLELVKSFTEKAASSIEYARLSWREIQLKTLVNRLTILETDKLDYFFENVVQLVKEEVGAKACSLFTVDHKKKVLSLVATTDRGQHNRIGEDIYKFSKSITARVATEGKIITSHNVAKEPGRCTEFLEDVGGEHRSFIGVPIKDKFTKTIAVLRCINKEKTPTSPTEYFAQDDEELLTLIATLISKFIESAEIEKIRYDYTQALTHEILAPATGIMAHTEYLIRNLENPEIPMERKMLKLKDILSDVFFLDFLVKGPRILEEKKEEYRIEDVDIYKDVIIPRINQLREIAHSVKLEFKLIGYQRLLFRLDRDKFDQIIFNLAYNAIKYSYENTEIVIRLVEKDDKYELSFENFGISVGEGEEEKIFKKYYRTEEAKLKHPTGKGLGCYLMKTICKNLGIEINLTQRENPTIFTLHLPKDLLVRRTYL